MADPFEKVSVGQDLEIRADTWNALLEAGQDYARRRGGREGGPQINEPLNPAVRVLVRNDTGAAVPVGSVLTLGVPIVSAADYPREASRSPVFPGTTPAAVTDQFAILLDPCDINEIGRAVIMGVIACGVNMNANADAYATPKAGDSTQMDSASGGGPAYILWRESGSSGTKKALVRVVPTPSAITTVEDEGTPLTQRAVLNFAGAGVTAVDDVANKRTNVNIPGTPTAVFGRSPVPAAVAATYFSGSWQDTDYVLSLPRAGTYLINVHATLRTFLGSGFPRTEWLFRVYDSTNAQVCDNLGAGATKGGMAIKFSGDDSTSAFTEYTPLGWHLVYASPSAATLTLQIRGFDITAGGPGSATIEAYSPALGTAPELANSEYSYVTFVLLNP